MNSDYLQQDNESFLDWKLRLIVGKIDREIDLDWVEIRDLLGLECSPDHLRKTAQGIYEYRDYVKDKLTDSFPSDIAQDIENKTIAYQKSKFQLQDQKRELANIIRLEARFEHLRDEIIKATSAVAKQKPLTWDLPISPASNSEAALLLSDWHKGLFAINYWNRFDNNEFNRRVQKLVVETIEHGKLHNINTLHVFQLGDLVNGWIHVTSRINATENVIAQTQSVAETLSEVLGKFSNEFGKVKLYFTRGNHDRVSPNKSDEIANESFADIIHWYIKARLSHIGNIEFAENTYDDEIINTDILGFKILAVHGHRDKPSDAIKNLTLMTKFVPDFVFMGHYHHHEEFEEHGIELIINSSLSGVDSYAKEIRKTGKPAQKLIIFNESGRLCTYNIRLDN